MAFQATVLLGCAAKKTFVADQFWMRMWSSSRGTVLHMKDGFVAADSPMALG